MDLLRVAYWAVYFAMAVSVVAAAILVWANFRSGSFVLATSSLAAAVVFYAVQLHFELRGSVQSETISGEFTIDHSKPGFLVTIPPPPLPQNAGSIVGAGDWLANKDLKAFGKNQPNDELITDLVMFSLVSYFGMMQSDWQLKTSRYRSSFATMKTWKRTSKPNECQNLEESELKELLQKAGNQFAEIETARMMPYHSICLPPNTRVTMTRNTLAFTNPFCTMTITIEPTTFTSYDTVPGTGESVEPLAEGKPRIETHVVGIEVNVTFADLRAHHTQAEKYHAWINRVVEGLHEWFERRQGT